MKEAPQVLNSFTPTVLFEQGKEKFSDSPDEAIQLIIEAKKKATEEESYELLIDILIFLSRTFRFQGKHFESLELLNESYRKLNQFIPHDQYRLAHVYKEFSSLYADGLKDFATGLDYSLKSLKLNIEELKGPLLNNIGCQYSHLNEFEKAYKYLLQGQEYCIENEIDYVLCFIYENLGNLFRLQKEYEKATSYYQLGFEACNKAYGNEANKQSIDFIFAYNCIGLAENYLKSNQIEELPELINKIIEVADASNLKSALSEAYLLEGKYLLQLQDYEAFEKLFHRSIEFCSEFSFFSDKEEWLQLIIHLYEEKGKYKEALGFSKIIIQNRNAQKSKKVNLANILESKENQILNLENRNREVQLQKEQSEQFAYIVAHDLKTPLSNISNFTNLVRKKHREDMDEQSQFYIDFVLVQSKHMQDMLDDLLRYITLKESDGNLTDVDVNKVLDVVVENFSEQITNKKAVIDYPSSFMVKIQYFHLEIILNNLVKNALKFSKNNEITKIKIAVNENASEYQFEVIDNGIGVEEQYHEKIFKVFRQLNKKNYHGTGMGLSICKKIVGNYGGKIWVSGNEWGGASFHFTIPKKVSL